MKKGVYPGSFNPPTVGHVAIVEAAIRLHQLDSIDLVISEVALAKPFIERPSLEERLQVITASFTEFPEASKTLPKDREIVMFCTGGIRCEKAYKYLKSQNFNAVKQLQGGIINYLNKTNGEDWEGECFVFDDRITLDKNLDPTYQNLCPRCQKIINAFDRSNCQICKEL